ncbi:MAG: type II toxin-antitoxin system PemK/MazF family toxin [Muribaculaceae bacterium]|nr:type II toxin-antitoxin system PemK/MazF family toxin [Muribaculaceae bacterium]
MKKFQLYSVNLDPTIGAEMKKTRPCLIVSPDEMNDYVSTVIIVPLTSRERSLPTRVLIKASNQSGLKNDSYAAIDQLKTIDKSRLISLIGEISETEKHEITNVLIEMFDY